MKALKWIAVLLFLMGALGCSHVQEYVDIIRGDPISQDYFDTLSTYTQEKTLYFEFETRIHVVATWKSRAFTDAYLAEYARLYHLTDAARQERRDIVSGVSGDFREFVFYAYVPDRESNDFSEADSVWKVFSRGEGGERVDPVEIREIEASPLVTKFFPYVESYGKFYSVKFPVSPPSDKDAAWARRGQTLVFTGVLGNVELTWKGGRIP